MRERKEHSGDAGRGFVYPAAGHQCGFCQYNLSFNSTKPSVAPKMEAAEVTETSVTLKEIEGAVYSNGGDWQESPVFTGLTPGKTYKFQSYLLAQIKLFTQTLEQ